MYLNPKYAKDLTLITIRESRNSPYLSTMNITSLVVFADNVTVSLLLLLHWLPTYSRVVTIAPICPH